MQMNFLTRGTNYNAVGENIRLVFQVLHGRLPWLDQGVTVILFMQLNFLCDPL